jgi:GGDEF domain-containing protein
LHSDRRQGLEIGNQLLADLRPKGVWKDGGETLQPLSASIGLAAVSLPPKNFAAEALVESAERCLFGAKTSGGNSIKSIELY